MRIAGLFWGLVVCLFFSGVHAADLASITPHVRNIFPDAEALGEFEGTPPSAAVLKGGRAVGYVLLTEDILRIPAYSGKPINTLVGIDTTGRIAGLAIVHHDEPILAVGITQERLNRFVSQYQGKSVFEKIIVGTKREGYAAIDGITGATITVMVENASVTRSAKMVAEARGIRPPEKASAERKEETGASPSAPQVAPTAAEAAAPASSFPSAADGTPEAGPQTPRVSSKSLDQEQRLKQTTAGKTQPRDIAETRPSVRLEPQSAPLTDRPTVQPAKEEPAWVSIWKSRIFDISLLAGGLIMLTFVLVFQDWLARDPTLLTYVRNGFHAYTLFFIGWWGLAQLSVINVLTFTGSIMSGFRWENFLIDPMLFILWGFVAMTLLLWGRGVYCGWLCPFGALQELILIASRKLKLPEVEFSDAVHERLVALKYIILILLFGVSLQSISEAAWYAEVEPFKTVITMRFQREWNYVLYALILIGVAAVNRKFYCKYLCPLGAALAIPGRFRLFEWWLRRRKECGKPCQVCANQCSVRAIRQTGEINANECHYCLDCQVIYYNEKVCLPLIDRRKRREQQLVRGQENRANSEAKALAVSGENPDDMAAPSKH